MGRKKKWKIRIFAGFVLVMAVCTVLSRAAASVLVAQVTVEKPGRGKLSYSYDGSGTVVPVKENQIFLWAGQQVEWIAETGSTVKAGDCLVRFRMEYLQQTIEQKEAELKQLELQTGQQEISARGTARVPAVVSAAQALADAQNQLQAARQKEAAAQAAYDQYVSGPGVAQHGEENGQAELEAALQEAQAEVEAAQQAVNQAQNAYALAEQEDAAQNTNDANLSESAQLGVQSLEVQVEQARKELEKLESYREADGKICAEQDCTVLQAGIQIGTVTTGSEILVTGSGGWRLKGLVDATDRDKLKPGAKADIRLGTGGKKTVMIESVGAEQKLEGESVADERTAERSTAGESPGTQAGTSGGRSQNCWYAALPENATAAAGENFTWTVEATSEKEYEQMIPLGALRESTDGAYCLVLSEESNMMGTVLKAKRVPVTVLEKDTKSAAVTSSLKDTDRVIVSSEKYVEEGDQVRLKE